MGVSRDKPLYRAPALDKGLDILEALAESRIPLTQTEIAQKLHRSPTEFFRMLTCLEERGYVQRVSPAGAYRLTLRLYELGHKQNAITILRNAARVPMEELAESSGQACHLCVQSGLSVLVLMERMPSGKVCLAVGEGTKLAMTETTSGRLLLSHMGSEQLNVVLDQDPHYKERTGADWTELVGSLEKLRELGYVDMVSQMRDGVYDAGCIVGSPGTDLFGTLVVSYLKLTRDKRANDGKYLQAVRRCVEIIHRNMGLHQ